MSLIDRIRTERYVTAMVALDNFDLITARVRQLLSHGRRMSMTQRYTYIGHSPELTVGLTVDTEARGGGIVEGGGSDGKHFGVYLRPGLLTGFGFSAYVSDGNATEDEAWKRYHAGAGPDDHWSRRRNMTCIELVGGMEGDGAARDDRIVISAWNEHGVCDEKVIGFDSGATR